MVVCRSRHRKPSCKIKLQLYESEDLFLLHLAGFCQSKQSRSSCTVPNNSLHTLHFEAGTQTLHSVSKDKEVQFTSVLQIPEYCQINSWQRRDDLDLLQSRQSASATRFSVGKSHTNHKSISREYGSLMNGGEVYLNNSQLDYNTLPRAVAVIEKVIVQNAYHKKVLCYRSYLSSEEYEVVQPSVQYLWTFQNRTVFARNVSCLAWNSLAPDLLAVGYGEFDFSNQRDGIVACWSLKNPDHPEWSCVTSSGVTTLDFSSKKQNLLAVGLYDGTVSVYNIHTHLKSAHLQSEYGKSGKHSEPVSKLCWIESGPDKDENVVSVSTDGRVTRWSLKKGLEYTDLMRLKPVQNKVSSPSDPRITLRGSGTSLSFSSHESVFYTVGSEDGLLHLCSTLQADQYLETFSGHNGPIRQVCWSPCEKDAFISASADGTIKLWSCKCAKPVCTFQSGYEEVTGVSWSPIKSTVFASSTLDGRLEIWDYSLSSLKPWITATFPGVKLTCVSFSKTASIVVAGSSDGNVYVFRISALDSAVCGAKRG